MEEEEREEGSGGGGGTGWFEFEPRRAPPTLPPCCRSGRSSLPSPPRSIPPPGPTSTRRFRAPWQYITTAAVLYDSRGRGRSLDLVV